MTAKPSETPTTDEREQWLKTDLSYKAPEQLREVYANHVDLLLEDCREFERDLRAAQEELSALKARIEAAGKEMPPYPDYEALAMTNVELESEVKQLAHDVRTQFDRAEALAVEVKRVTELHKGLMAEADKRLEQAEAERDKAREDAERYRLGNYSTPP